jgi:hypothetical protein
MSARHAFPLLAAALTLAFAGFVQLTGQKPGCVLAQALLAGYAALPPDEREARRLLLTGAQLLGPARTAAAAGRVRTRLALHPSPAEQATLLHMLAGLYAAGDPTGLNERIAGDLRAYTASADVLVARAAALDFARLGYRAEQPAVLRDAHARGLLDGDDYACALAALLPAAPPAIQAELAGTLAANGGARSAEALALSLERARDLPPAAARPLLRFMLKREPAFPADPAQYFHADARRDARWLSTVAGLRAAAGEAHYADAVLAALNDPQADARRPLAFLNGPEGRALMREVAARAPFLAPLARAEAYAGRVPQEETVTEAARDARFAVWSLTR